VPIFPELDISAQINWPDVNGAVGSPADEPVGVMAGLNSSLLQLLNNFSPGELGVCVVDEKLQLTLPVPEWAWYGYIANGTTSFTAGQQAELTILSVPTDERWWLDAFWVQRVTGDNLIKLVSYYQGPGYSDAGEELRIFDLATDKEAVTWPFNGAFASDWAIGPNPLLLEPGAYITLSSSGDGVATTPFFIRAQVRKTKLIRARAP